MLWCISISIGSGVAAAAQLLQYASRDGKSATKRSLVLVRSGSSSNSTILRNFRLDAALGHVRMPFPNALMQAMMLGIGLVVAGYARCDGLVFGPNLLPVRFQELYRGGNGRIAIGDAGFTPCTATTSSSSSIIVIVTAVLSPNGQGAKARQVDAPIGRDPRNRLRMAVVESGKPALTDFELLQAAANGCWVRATLQTGRTHQIRVHMAHIGHPLAGDVLYGGAATAALSRQGLHAYRLAFAHPATGEALEFHAPIPQDLQQALAAWRLRYNGREWPTSHAP